MEIRKIGEGKKREGQADKQASYVEWNSPTRNLAKSIKGRNSTRASHVVRHRSTNPARRRTPSQSGRGVVLSTWYSHFWRDTIYLIFIEQCLEFAITTLYLTKSHFTWHGVIVTDEIIVSDHSLRTRVLTGNSLQDSKVARPWDMLSSHRLPGHAIACIAVSMHFPKTHFVFLSHESSTKYLFHFRKVSQPWEKSMK